MSAIDPTASDNSPGDEDAPVPALVDELGVVDLQDLIVGKFGKLFSVAGPDAPVVELAEDYMVVHPAELPFEEERATEEIVRRVDEFGVALDELGNRRRIAGARYNGQPIYVMGELKPATLQHVIAWFDQTGQPRRLFIDGQVVTVDLAYRLRNRTHDGELAVFPDLVCE